MRLGDIRNRGDDVRLHRCSEHPAAGYKTQVGEEMGVVARRLVVVQNDDRHLEEGL